MMIDDETQTSYKTYKTFSPLKTNILSYFSTMKFLYLLLCLPILINVVLSISADRAGSSSKKHSNVVSKILFLIIALYLTNIYFRAQR